MHHMLPHREVNGWSDISEEITLKFLNSAVYEERYHHGRAHDTEGSWSVMELPFATCRGIPMIDSILGMDYKYPYL